MPIENLNNFENNAVLLINALEAGTGFTGDWINYDGTDVTFSPSGSVDVTIDDSGNVGIGTTSPSTALDVTGTISLTGGITSSSTIDIGPNAFGAGVNLKRGNGSVNGISLTSGGDISFYEDTGTTAKFFWDASEERLGIGTTSPAHKLHVADATTPEIIVEDTTNGVKAVLGADNSVGRIGTDTNHPVTFRTNDTERMRIDSSGNLIVAGTSAGAADTTTVSTSGYIWARKTDQPAAYLDRLTTDGTITEFRKDGSAVGSIGTVSDDMSIGTGDVRIRFDDAGDAITPRKADDTANPNAVDVGSSGAAFKDVYMAGTLHLDGNPVGGTEVTIADDAVASITPPRTGGFMAITVNGDTDYPIGAGFGGLFYYDVGLSLNILELSTGMGSTTDVSVSDVVGTTGTDGNVTIAVQSGVIKIENRQGGTCSFQVTFL